MGRNNKKRTHDVSTIAKTTKKVKNIATSRDNSNDASLSSVDNIIPIYQIVKEGRVSGYPIIVSQVGSEHDAILLGCKDNPQDYLNNNKDGKVKIRWKFAGYNGLVPTHTVRLKVVDGAPPIRKAAVLSGLLETGEEVVATDKDDINLGEEANQEKARITTQSGIKLEDGDADSVATDPMVNEEVVPLEVTSDIIKTEREETDNDEHKPSAVASNMNVKLEGEEDTDDESVIQQVTSSSDVKIEGEAAYEYDTDNEEHKPLEVKSDMNLKTEEVETDDEMDAQQVEPVASNDIKMEGDDAAYGYDTDNDEPMPLEVKSDMNVKVEEEDTDDEMNTSSLISDNVIPTVSASISEEEEDIAVVLEFFEKLNACLEEDRIAYLDRLIKANPYLLNATCPQNMDYIGKGCTAMEAVCCQVPAGATSRDMLYRLVRLGGKATDKCYENIDYSDFIPFEHLAVLLLSGYYPKKGIPLFLDWLAERFDYDICGANPIETLSILYKIVKQGDKLSCGHIGSTVTINNINQLPPLEAGVTHSKGGSMEELLEQFPMSKVKMEYEQMQRKARDEIVLEFFKKLNSYRREQSMSLGDLRLGRMIYENPYLLEAKCPLDMDNIKEGTTATIVLDKCRSSKAKKNARCRRKRKEQRDLSRKEVEERKKKPIVMESMYSISKDHHNDFFEKQRAKVDALHKKKLESLTPKQKKEREKELVCSVCKLSKNLHDDYFKKQRSKEECAKCKTCVEEERKKKVPSERKEKEEQKKKEQEWRHWRFCRRQLHR